MMKINVMTVEEFEKEIDDIDTVALKSGCVRVYFRDDDIGAYVGCEYNDGTYSVVGLCADKFCDFETMMNYVMDIED